MKPKLFLQKIDDPQVVEAIAAAEAKTTGEIRVFVTDQNVSNAIAAARTEFERLGMSQTKRRNGVLIFFAPRSQAFAILGDAAIHEKVGDGFWDEIAREMARELKNGCFTGAILLAVNRVGEALARHFPPEPDDHNELPDSIVRSDG